MRAVSVEDIKPGMILARSLVNDEMIVVLSEETVLNKAHITRLTNLNIPVVYVKDEYELSQNYQTAASVFHRSNAFTKEYKSVVKAAQAIFNHTRQDEELPMEETETIVTESIAPLAQNSGAVDYLYELSHHAEDVYNHSLRVSIMSGVIAKWMHFDRDEVNDIILAGFLHDIGKTKMPERLLNKSTEGLQGEDYETYQKHTMDGHKLLNAIKGKGSLSEGVKLTAMQHHERMNGAGFPFGCAGTEIHEYARIVAVADIYDNITTERIGKVKRTPFDAITYLTENLYTTLDPTVCVPFLTHIKDAFLGSRIVLSTGQNGIIASFPNDFAARPVVSIAADKLVNLNDHPEIAITEYNPK